MGFASHCTRKYEMNGTELFAAQLSRMKEEAKKVSRGTSKKHKVILEELAKKYGFPNYDTLRKLAKSEFQGADKSSVIADIPPPIPTLRYAHCRTPAEFHAHRDRFGNPNFAVTIFDDDSGRFDDVWFFTNNVQDASAIGMRWHERRCSLEQYPVKQEGGDAYGYRVRGLSHNRALEDLLYEGWLWQNVGADMNAIATPEIMTKLRQELFVALSCWADAHLFMMLDFSCPDQELEFFKCWADELEE